MKTAIYIEDGVIQMVITPENDFEKNTLRAFGDGPIETVAFVGSFYDCRGGWVRQSDHYPYANNASQDRSLIVRMLKNK